jgi:hypothetical protein
MSEHGVGIVARPPALARAVRSVIGEPGFAECARQAFHRGVFAAAERIVSLSGC